MQAQFPLHSGRILGLPGRIMISIMGAIVAMLSITGILIWARKRKSRVQSRMPSREQQLRKIAQ
ncbi:PepSY domain-containing protein [Methylobacillus glycogenes]|uniref:PepSY domain-containing protein n=1 Tax=Methylobacillus glycogenes TaxID=406 RepID=UPI001F3BA4D6|nr:PepSY-associated TM helix domain-containing protein [Methylobacillus glycogenes]